jgi:hypothetical protein
MLTVRTAPLTDASNPLASTCRATVWLAGTLLVVSVRTTSLPDWTYVLS